MVDRGRRRRRRARNPSQALNIIAANIDMAADDEAPICQDTGMPTFFVHTPVGREPDRDQARPSVEAVAEATRRGKLRPNSVDSLTGKNSGDNLGRGDAGHSFRAVGRGRDRGEADPEGRRLREQEHPVFACRANSITWAAPTATWKACASASCMRCGRRRDRVARRAPSACASAAIARTATNWRSGSSSARSTT